MIIKEQEKPKVQYSLDEVCPVCVVYIRLMVMFVPIV